MARVIQFLTSAELCAIHYAYAVVKSVSLCFGERQKFFCFTTAYSTDVKISGTQRNILISYDKISILYLHQTYYNIVMVFWR